MRKRKRPSWNFKRTKIYGMKKGTKNKQKHFNQSRFIGLHFHPKVAFPKLWMSVNYVIFSSSKLWSEKAQGSVIKQYSVQKHYIIMFNKKPCDIRDDLVRAFARVNCRVIRMKLPQWIKLYEYLWFYLDVDATEKRTNVINLEFIILVIVGYLRSPLEFSKKFKNSHVQYNKCDTSECRSLLPTTHWTETSFPIL